MVSGVCPPGHIIPRHIEKGEAAKGSDVETHSFYDPSRSRMNACGYPIAGSRLS